MSQTEIRGVVRGQTVILSESPLDLPDGTEVFVTPVAPRRGSPVAVLDALAKHEPLGDQEAAKMLRDIDEAYGKVSADE